MITFPFWFKIVLGLCAFCLVTQAARFFTKNKLISTFKNYPDEKRNKLLRIYTVEIKINKIFLMLSPINLIIIPYLVYLYRPQNFFHIAVMTCFAYIFLFEDYLFRKSILQNLN
jgi:hypothetical protein